MKPYSGYPSHRVAMFPPDDGGIVFFLDDGPTSSSGVLLWHTPSTCRPDSLSSSTALPLSIPLGEKSGIKFGELKLEN